MLAFMKKLLWPPAGTAWTSGAWSVLHRECLHMREAAVKCNVGLCFEVAI